MIGISATKAIAIADNDPILSPTEVSWKNIAKFIIAKSNNGKNIVAAESQGCL